VADTVVTVIVRARDEFSKTFSNFKGGALDVAKVAGAVSAASAAVAGGLLAVSASAGQQANDLQVLGQRYGLTTSEVSKLDFAAGQLDTKLSDVTAALGFMQRTLFAARSGSEEAQRALKALGFSTKEIESGLGGTNNAFRTIIDRLSEVEDAGIRAGLQFAVFGRGAAAITPVILGGSAALDEYAAQAEKTGAVISNTAGILGDEFGDALEVSKRQIEGLKAAIAEALLPSMTEAVTATQGYLATLIRITREHPNVSRAVLETTGAIAGLAGVVGSAAGAIALFRLALVSAGVSAGALAAAGGPIALVIVALGALALAFAAARDEAEKPLRFNIGVDDVSLEAAEARLKQLEGERAKLAARLQEERRADRAAGIEEPRPEAAGVPRTRLVEGPTTETVKQIEFLDGQIKKLQERIQGFKKEAAADDPFDPIGAGAEKAKDKVQDLLDTIARASRPAALSEEDIRKALEPPTELRPPRDRFGQPLAPPSTDLTPAPEIEVDNLAPRLGEAGAQAALLHEALELVGIDVTNIHASLETIPGVLEAIGEGVRVAFEGTFDPLRTGIQDAQAAVFQFGDTVIGTLDASLRGFILEGQKGLKSLGDFFLNVGRSVAALTQQIIILTIRTLLLKAIGGFLFGGGGQARVVDTIGQAAGGGVVRRFGVAAAAGGLVVALAAGGSGRVDATPGGQIRGPGTATSDSIPAWLSDREFVVRTAVVDRPGHLAFLRAFNRGQIAPEAIQSLAGGAPAGAFSSGGAAQAFASGGYAGGGVSSTSFSTPAAQVLVDALRPQRSEPSSRRAPISVHVHARDADSVRRDLALGGRTFRELQRLQDEGRL
jgi:hypothetical protein